MKRHRQMKPRLWHKDFSWNGSSFSSEQDIIEFVEDYYPELSVFINEWFGDSGQIHIKTSGSTGTPKTIVLSRDHMINSAKATSSYFNLGKGSKALLCLPLGFIAGRMMLVRALLIGWKIDVIHPRSKPDIPKRSVYDFSAMVPMQLFNSIADLKNIKTLIVGGGKVSDTILKKISGLSTKIYATYGMTETITHVALSPVNQAAGFSGGDPVFKALGGVEFSTDKRDCLVVKAPKIANDIIITNDVVDLRSNTSFKWLARYDHVINSGGIKLFPELIEKKWNSLIDAPFFLAALKDKVLGQRMVMLVEQEEVNDLMKDLKDFQQKKSDKISLYEIPKEIYFLPSFCYTETGKIQRNLTLEQILV